MTPSRTRKLKRLRARPKRRLLLRANDSGAAGLYGFRMANVYRYGLAILTLALIFRLTLMIRRREAGAYTDIDAFAALEILLVGCTAAFLAIIPQVGAFIRKILQSPSRHFFLYYIFGIFSALWSVRPEFSVYRASQVLIESFAISVLIMSLPGFKKAEKWVLQLVWIALIFRVLGSIRLLGFSLGGLRDNTLGAMAVMVACYSFAEWLVAEKGERKRNLLFSFIGSLILTVGSLSLASWWSLLGGLLLVCVLSQKGIKVLALVGVSLVCLYFVKPDTIDEMVYRDKEEEEIKTLHGRTRIWDSYWQGFLRKPILGYGFAVGAREQGAFYTTNTHNVFFGVVLNCGLIGLIIFGTFVWTIGKDMLHTLKTDRPGSLGAAGFLASGGVNSLAVGYLGEAWKTATFTFVCFLALFCLHIVQARRSISS